MKEYTDPKFWGPYFWFMMRCIAYNFPSDASYHEKKYIIDFYNNLKNVLPCKKCRKNYGNILDKYPVENFLQSRNHLFDWVEMIYQQTDNEKGMMTQRDHCDYHNNKSNSYDEINIKRKDKYQKSIVYEIDNNSSDSSDSDGQSSDSSECSKCKFR